MSTSRRRPQRPSSKPAQVICPACGGAIAAPEFFDTKGPRFAEELARIGAAITASASFVLSWADVHQQLRFAVPPEPKRTQRGRG